VVGHRSDHMPVWFPRWAPRATTACASGCWAIDRGVRGRKAWALLACLLLADRPPSRRHLAELLFADADDRWGRCAGPWPSCGGPWAPPACSVGTRWPTASRPAWRLTCSCWPPSRPTRRRCWGSRGSCWRASGSRPARRSSPGWWWSGTGSRRWSRPGCAMPPWGRWPAALRQVAVCEDTLRRARGRAVAGAAGRGRHLGRPWPPWAARWSTHRELGFVEVQAGRRQTAEAWLARAEALADTDAQLAPILGVRAMTPPTSRSTRPPSSTSGSRWSGPSAAATPASRPGRCRSWPAPTRCATSASQAAFALGRSLELVQEQRWIAFLPWPQALEASWSSAPAASPPPTSGSSMPTRWPASWATPAGRAWPRVGWGCSGPPWATMPSPRPGRRRRTSAAPGSATATSGAGATSSTPWSPPPSSNTTTPGPGGWPTAWRRWPRAAACASWWSAPTSTAATSATRPPWPPRLLAGSIDNPALARLLDRGPG